MAPLWTSLWMSKGATFFEGARTSYFLYYTAINMHVLTAISCRFCHGEHHFTSLQCFCLEHPASKVALSNEQQTCEQIIIDSTKAAPLCRTWVPNNLGIFTVNDT